MKWLFGFGFAGLYLALLVSGYGIFVHSQAYAQPNGAKVLRCTYLKATSIETRHMPLAGQISVTCPKRI